MRQRACVYDEGKKLVLDTQVGPVAFGSPRPLITTVPVERIQPMDHGVKVWSTDDNTQWTLYPWHTVLWVDALP